MKYILEGLFWSQERGKHGFKGRSLIRQETGGDAVWHLAQTAGIRNTVVIRTKK